MSRKRRGGPGAAAATALLGCCLLLLHGNASGYGEVGCLFSKNLCEPDTETCYNDMAFGRCVRLDDEILSGADLYQYNLKPDELELLRMQLERLEYEGYKWPHDYTQCVMQILLDDIHYRMNNDVEFICRNLKEKKFDEENLMVDKNANIPSGIDPMGLVKYMPSKVSSEYADEFYYPTQQLNEERRKATAASSPADTPFGDYDEAAGLYDKLAAIGNLDEVYRGGSHSLSKKSINSASSTPYLSDINYALPLEYVEALRGYLDKEATKYNDHDEEHEDELEFLANNQAADKKPIVITDYQKTFTRKYKYPSRELENVDFLDRTLNNDDNDDDDDDDDYEDNDNKDDDEMEADADVDGDDVMRPIIASLSRQTGVYTERGTIIPTRRDDSAAKAADEYDDITLGDDDDDDLNGILWREMAGFKRRERLDVKKPGPLFSTNNYAFKAHSTEAPENQIRDTDKENKQDVEYLPAQVKKEITSSRQSSTSKAYENVDLDHVYVEFDQAIATWPEGKRIVNVVETLIGLQQGELKDTRVGRAEVTFKVPDNSLNYNATDIVHKIDEVRNSLQKQLNMHVIRAGIGDKAKLPAMLEVSPNSEMSTSVFGALVAAGVAGVTAAAIVVLVIARRHAKSRAKLAGLRTPDPEASKDYQELCRARMAAKQSDKANDSPKGFDFGRLIESGKSESNRSSTSSWGEEPQVTHMDVATGHVVLSYMEEHLKNQEKLDEEWAALCAYEAEPCSTAIAEAEGNAECNRPGAALPYDHSRVILNDLTNLNNSDYINASTITDHDPRNPAYIATQGPMPQTTADFWQLVWEQGSVVIVMLTRLTEEGQSMCHRYWPEEGSELYHIYEVHLVSEHVWCNEYLVRSFYLKNLRSAETRTVTQFHYLDWPHNQVPKSTKTLLEFRRKVNKSYRGRSCPIIVHCSDGAGRTGTYCLIDMVLNRMSKGAKEIDIAATLEHIRDQRSNMVADKQQFEFALMAVAEEVHSILKSLPIVAEKSTTGDDKSTTKSDK